MVLFSYVLSAGKSSKIELNYMQGWFWRCTADSGKSSEHLLDALAWQMHVGNYLKHDLINICCSHFLRIKADRSMASQYPGPNKHGWLNTAILQIGFLYAPSRNVLYYITNIRKIIWKTKWIKYDEKEVKFTLISLLCSDTRSKLRKQLTEIYFS